MAIGSKLEFGMDENCPWGLSDSSDVEANPALQPKASGWDLDSISSHGSHHDDPAVPVVATEPSAISKRGAGRPKGTTGSHLLRERLKQQAESEAAAEAAVEKPHGIAYARQCKKEKSEKTQQQKAMQGQLCIKEFFPTSTVGNIVQRCVSATFEKIHQRTLDVKDSTISYLLENSTLTASATAVAGFLSTSKTQVQRQLVAAASCVLETGGWLWGQMLSLAYTLYTDSSSGGKAPYDAVMCVVKTKYDETPSKVRVVETPERTYLSPIKKKSPADFLDEDDLAEYLKLTESGTGMQTSTHAKVLQTQLELGMLLKDKASGHFVFLTGEVPTSLQVVDRTTAENIRACLWDSIQAWGSAVSRRLLKGTRYQLQPLPTSDIKMHFKLHDINTIH